MKLPELEEGVVSGRKYTILFQRKADEEGMINSEEVEYYILLEKSYYEIVGALQHPEPVFVTKNGYGDLVVMSIETYDRLVDSAHADLAIAESECRGDLYVYYG